MPSASSAAARTAQHLTAGLPVSGLEDFYRDLHRHPELSLQEHRTAAKLAERLRKAGYETAEGIGGTGVVGLLRNGDGPTVLLRADMDALPVREDTGLSYASVETADGEPVMHACGHDVHVTCLLGAVALLARSRAEWSGTVVALFSPPRRPRTAHAGCSTTAWPIWSGTWTWRWLSTSFPCPRVPSAPDPVRLCPRRTASASRCTG